MKTKILRNVNYLSPMVRTWQKCVKQYIYELRKYEDLPYMYGERANTSVLSGAIWKSNNIALTEYTGTKKYRNSKYSGRPDLYFVIGSKENVVEAKDLWINTDSSINDIIYYANNLMNEAKKQLNSIELEHNDRKLAVIFVMPRYRTGENRNIIKILENISNNMMNIFDIVAPCFPRISRNYAEKKWIYPGIILCIKDIGI